VTKIIRLQVIPSSNFQTKIISSIDERNVVYRGSEIESHICGNCGFVLMHDTIVYNYYNLVIKCPNCKSFNGAPPDY
jgi:predicted Zn-ribbon and HTH transcriptional regulator